MASLDRSEAVGWWQDGSVTRFGVGHSLRGVSLTKETCCPGEGRVRQQILGKEGGGRKGGRPWEQVGMRQRGRGLEGLWQKQKMLS